MQKNASKYPYVFPTEKQRKEALELPPLGRNATVDRIISYLVQNAEVIFQPKQVHTANDWLVTQKEAGQTPKKYKQGSPFINWMGSRNRKIILFVLDQTIDVETS